MQDPLIIKPEYPLTPLPPKDYREDQLTSPEQIANIITTMILVVFGYFIAQGSQRTAFQSVSYHKSYMFVPVIVLVIVSIITFAHANKMGYFPLTISSLCFIYAVSYACLVFHARSEILSVQFYVTLILALGGTPFAVVGLAKASDYFYDHIN